MTAFTIETLHKAYNEKKTKPSEVAQDFLKRVEGSRLNAFLTVCKDRVLASARDADAVLAREGKVPEDRQPLFGVPMAFKDNLTIDGVRTTCASKILDTYVPPYTATSVERLERAGALTIGKTNLDEFAMGGSNENSAYGPVLHPTHPDRVPGGSSGGSAAAVGGDLAVCSLGSDTGGSIRLPASFCGIVGMKPTYGRVSRYGLVAFGSSLDQIGPFAHTVDDAARVFSVMSGHDPHDSTSLPKGAFSWAEYRKQAQALGPKQWQGVRVGVPKEYFVAGLQSEVEKSVRGALAWMEKQGAKLVPISLPHTPYSVAVYYLVAVSEASSNLARYDGVRFGSRRITGNEKDIHDFYRSTRALFGSEVKRRIILGTYALSAGYADAYYGRACQVRRLIQNDFIEAFKQCDVIAGPVSPTTAFKLGEQAADPLTMYLNDIFTIPANLAGLPAISVPIPGALDANKLPIGLQLHAPVNGEEKLLPLASAFSRGFA